jgi:hypothetical protein
VRTVARVALPILLVAVVVALAALAVFEGVTEPANRLLGLSARHADIVACWAVFLALPLSCAVDASLIDEARWAAAQRSKPAWLGLLAYVPVVGPLLYVTVARPVVTGAPPDRPPSAHSTPRERER